MLIGLAWGHLNGHSYYINKFFPLPIYDFLLWNQVKTRGLQEPLSSAYAKWNREIKVVVSNRIKKKKNISNRISNAIFAIFYTYINFIYFFFGEYYKLSLERLRWMIVLEGEKNNKVNIELQGLARMWHLRHFGPCLNTPIILPHDITTSWKI